MKEKKQQRLIDVYMPSSLEDWLLTGALFLFFFVNPYGIIDRIFDLMDKGVEYRVAITIVAFFISLPYYLRLRKKLHKYQEDKWEGIRGQAPNSKKTKEDELQPRERNKGT